MLLHGCSRERAALDAQLAVHLDRKAEQLSPVEHAVLLIGSYELQHCIDIPYKVAINEAVERPRASAARRPQVRHGVLDKTAAALRSVEVEAARARRASRADKAPCRCFDSARRAPFPVARHAAPPRRMVSLCYERSLRHLCTLGTLRPP